MRGKHAIVAILSLAVAMAGFAWWSNYQRSARARQFWGPNAAIIRFASRVEVFEVDRSDKSVDVSQAPGLLNARTALMADDGFDWAAQPDPPSPADRWTWGARFSHDSKAVTLLFSNEHDVMLVSETGQTIALDPKTAAGWRNYLQRALMESSRRPGFTEKTSA